MTRRRLKLTLLMIFMLLSLAYCGYYYTAIYPNTELGQKKAWSTLQVAEVRHRGAADQQTPILLENAYDTGYAVLGLPTGDPTTPRAWILLNEHGNSGSVKVLPGGAEFHVRCAYVAELISKIDVDENTASLLHRKCTT
jgi:hypothetical protein